MGDHLGIGIGAERRACFLQLLAQLAEILDDAIVDDGEALGGMRVRVMFGRSAVGRPPGVANADRAGERLTREPGFEISQLALGPPADELPPFQRGDASGVIAPIFEPLECIDKQARDRLTPETAYYSGHASGALLCPGAQIVPRRRCIGGKPRARTPATAPATRLNGSRILTICTPSSVTCWHGSASFRNAPLGIASPPVPLENLSGLGKKARCGCSRAAQRNLYTRP